MLTIESLTVYADQMICTNPLRTCAATGKVTAEVNGERIEGTKVEVDLVSRKLNLVRNAEIDRAF